MKKTVFILTLLFLFTFSFQETLALSNNLQDQVNKFCDHKTDVTKVDGYLCSLVGVVANLNSQVTSLQNQLTVFQQMTTSKVLFDDDFTESTLDPTVWDIHDNGGTINLSNGELTLSSDGTTRFPFIQPKNTPMPDWDEHHFSIDNYTMEIRMKYNITNTQAGFVFNDAIPADPNSFPGIFDVDGVWGNGVIFNENGDHIITPIPDNNYHTYRFVGTPLTFYHVYLDGNLIKTGQGPHAAYFYIGSPISQPRAGSISIKYIRVTTKPDEFYWGF